MNGPRRSSQSSLEQRLPLGTAILAPPGIPPPHDVSVSIMHTASENGPPAGIQQPSLMPGAPHAGEERDTVTASPNVGSLNLGQSEVTWPSPTPVTAEPRDTTAGPRIAGVAPPGRRGVAWASPMPVSWFVHNRYNKRPVLSTHPEQGVSEIKQIPAKNRLPSRGPARVGRGWEPFVHPEGQLYFRLEERFYTNQYLYDNACLADVEEAVDQMNLQLHQHRDLPEKIEINLDIYEDEETKVGCYYICNPETEEVFWLEDVSIDYLVEEEDLPIYDKEHLKFAHGFHYWHHVQMFPHGRTFTEDKLEELRMILTYHLHDRQTSRTSNAPYGEDALHSFIQIFEKIKIPGMSLRTYECLCDLRLTTMATGDTISEYDMAKIARMKTLLSLEQLRHYHGTRWARLDSNRSVHKDVLVETRHSWWFTFASWVFFRMPAVYINRLDEMWVDHRIDHQSWSKFIIENQEDWTEYIITPSTVILTADVGFLAIQSVDQNGVAEPKRTPGQILSYTSIILVIGNIIACIVLSRQHRHISRYHADRAFRYMMKRASKRWQAELLAVVLSIPMGFFMYGLLFFLAAVLWSCIHATSVGTRVAVVIAVLFTVMLLSLVALNADWTSHEFAHSSLTQMFEEMRHVPRRLSEHARRLTAPLRETSFNPKARRDSKKPSDPEEIPIPSAPPEIEHAHP